jgi:hypothetical protein
VTIPLANPEPSTNVRYAVRFRGERTSLAPIRTVPYAGLPAGVLGYVRVRMFDFGGVFALTAHKEKAPRTGGASSGNAQGLCECPLPHKGDKPKAGDDSYCDR